MDCLAVVLVLVEMAAGMLVDGSHVRGGPHLISVSVELNFSFVVRKF